MNYFEGGGTGVPPVRTGGTPVPPKLFMDEPFVRFGDMKYRLGILSTHPIQYYSPWYRALTEDGRIDLTVYYAHQQTPQGQADAGFGVAFQWDVPLLDGYRYEFLPNQASHPNVSNFWGCHTPAVARRILERQFDAFVVHGWYSRCFWQAMRACWRSGTPLLVRGDSQRATPRGLARRLVKQVAYRAFIPRFDGYLVVGERARDYYLAYGARPERMFFAPHFVDNSFFASAAAQLHPRRNELRARWGLAPGQVGFVFAGKFIPKKRPLDFVAAIAAAAQRAPMVRGLMVGDGPLRPHVEDAIARTGAPVHLCGFLNQQQIPEAYVAGDVLVLPSDGGETWGLVVNEAMACGLPALVSDQVGCGPDLVLPDQTGFVFPCGDVEHLTALIVRTAGDAALRQRLGTSARAHMRAYSVEAATEGTCRAVAWCVQHRTSQGESPCCPVTQH